MSDVWTVQVGGQNYGPYPLERMQAFIAEGRILPQSLVAYGEEQGFHAAGDDLLLSQFMAPQHELQAEPEPVEEEEPEPEPARRADAPAQKFGRLDEGDEEPSHMVIFFDLKSYSGSMIEEMVYSLGSAFSLMPQVWLLTTTESVTGVRNLLVQKLGKLDTLFIVDASHDKAAWFNFSPEPEARIRRIWGGDAAKRKAG